MDKSLLEKIPLLPSKTAPSNPFSPTDPEWELRLKQELLILINLIKQNKKSGNDWFSIECLQAGLFWKGKCWYWENYEKYEFNFEFELPVGFPAAPPEIKIPELEGKTPKM